jgi:hypothetical protein
MTAGRARDWRDLRSPPGEPGSGRLRYAAAMGLWRAGALPEPVLEVYRTLALDDRADPEAELARHGLAPPRDNRAPAP